MPDQPLPVYQIRNFEEQEPGRSDFYISLLSGHLQRHKFIQKPHKHDFYIVMLVTSGTGTHTIDFVTYEVKPGAVFFLSPGQVHSWNLSADTSGFITFFTQEFYLLGYPHKKLLSFPFFNVLLRPFLVLPQAGIAQATNLFLQTKAEHELKPWRYADVVRDLLDILLILFARVYQQHNAGGLPTPGHYTLLQQLDELIEQHFREHQPVSFYAGKLHITNKQLNDNCRQSLGKTTSELIQARVILEARRLLIHSDLTVTQIAAELGYFDNNYFSRFFKKQTSETPEQFRQNNRLQQNS